MHASSPKILFHVKIKEEFQKLSLAIQHNNNFIEIKGITTAPKAS